MDFTALRLATEWGGHVLAGPTPAHTLILLERLQGHGYPGLLVLGRRPEDLEGPLAAAKGSPRLNLMAILPAEATDLAIALPFHRQRIGSLIGAIDAGLTWLEGRPMMIQRLPGRLRAPQPLPLEPAFLRPLEKADLLAHLGSESITPFITPEWLALGAEFEVFHWPEVPIPLGANAVQPSLVIPNSGPFPEALRHALRAESVLPVPWLPHVGDPGPLQALALLTPQIAAFQGGAPTWLHAMQKLADLPAPPHFCARC